MSTFRFSHTAIDIALETEAVHDPAAGGFASFEGWVRNHNEGRTVSRLQYEAFESLAIREGEKIVAEAIARFGILKAHCVHRVGDLAIGDRAVWVGASSPHRAEAFAACRYIIDEVKHRVPIWKKEFYTDGDSGWVNCERCAQPSPEHSAHHHHHDHHTHPPHSTLTPTRSAATPSAAYVPDYSRQMTLKDIGPEGQQKLRSAKVCVIGAGGLGVPTALYLAGAGIGVLGLIDHDVIDASNLHRQPIYTHDQIGQSKTLTLKRHLNQLNPTVDIRAYEMRAEFTNLLDLAKGYDLLVDCSDNFTTRFVVNDVARALQLPAVVASVYQYEGQIQVIAPQGACLRCIWPEATRDGLVGNCQEAGVLGPLPGALGALQALEVIKWIVGLNSPLSSHVALLDFLSMQTRLLKVTQHAQCAVLHTAPTPQAAVAELPSLQAALDRGMFLIDIREEAERQARPVSAPHHCHSSAELLAQPELANAPHGTLLMCARGIRSKALAEALSARGIKNVYSLKGGLG